MSESVQNSKIIRDPAFARRLQQAVESHPLAPSGHGRQRWLLAEIKKRDKGTHSPEKIRKYFHGEAKPRPALMSLIAQILEVDEAWLSLGITPTEKPREKAKRNATADGAVNFLAGLIQMAGGTIAFPESKSDAPQPDLIAIIDGQHRAIEVKRLSFEGSTTARLHVPVQHEDLIVVCVIDTHSPTKFDLVRVPSEIVAEHAARKGGFLELPVKQSGNHYVTSDDVLLPIITDMRHLEGKAPKVNAGRRTEAAPSVIEGSVAKVGIKQLIAELRDAASVTAVHSVTEKIYALGEISDDDALALWGAIKDNMMLSVASATPEVQHLVNEVQKHVAKITANEPGEKKLPKAKSTKRALDL